MSLKNTSATENEQKSHSGNLFLWVLIILFAALSLAWLSCPVSREEGFADTARYPDVFRGMMSHGPSWWNPNYMLGQHLSTMYVAGLSVGLLSAGVNLFGSLIGAMASFKVVVVLFAAGALVAMNAFLRALGADRLTAIVGAGIYFLIPGMTVRGPVYEHYGMFMVFIFIPLLFRGIIVVANRQSPAEIVLLGVAASGLALSYAKIAVTMAPVLGIWAWAVLRDREDWAQLIKAYLFALGVAVLCGVIPLLSGAKEFTNAAGFLFDPLEGWKHHYSFKTALSLWDPSGYLLRGAGADVESDAAFYHVGAVPLVLLTIGLALRGLASWRETKVGQWFLILNASWLVSLWFASGPTGIMGGHLALLNTAQQVHDISIPLSWLSLAWLGWVIWMTAFQILKGKIIPALIFTALVLLLPVFHVAELVFPFYRDIRAPESFFSTSGLCFIAAAAALAGVELFRVYVPHERRTILAIAAVGVLIFQLISMFGIYTSRMLPDDLFKDYADTCSFLKTAPLQGRVHPLSGRYFYLTLPEQAGRGLDSEASGRHFQMKWIRYLEAAGNSSAEAMKSYLDLAGVSYILLDKEDPFSPKQMQDFFRANYPAVYENRYFAVLENQATLYPAFLAHDFVSLPVGSYALAPAALQFFPQNIVTVEQSAVNPSQLGFAGAAKGTNQIELRPEYQGRAGQPFEKVPLVGNRMDDYQHMTYQLSPTSSGWLVVSEAYHPDWRVTIDGHPGEVTRAEGALLSTFVPAGSHEVAFHFKAPAWYTLSLYAGILSWILALGALFYLPSKWSPARWKKWWIGK